uniref:DCD domain-containing protein n=1 Tax=Kalanchoe fedtschenkoi TaxID=63787 RepID=A0A7N0UGQ4_KALFE
MEQQFWQFTDKLRGSNHLPLNNVDSIWSTSYVSKHPRNNFNLDFTNSHPPPSPTNNIKFLPDDFTATTAAADDSGAQTQMINQGFKFNFDKNNTNTNSDYITSRFNSAVDLNHNHKDKWAGSDNYSNGGFNKGVYSKNYNNLTSKNYKQVVQDFGAKFPGKKNNGNKNNHNNNNSGGAGGVEKRFKTLPPSESLPRNETVGGYIFVCNNDTMQENLQRQLFGLPPRYRDSVRAITPGLPLFLYNYSTHQLHGVFEAASFGGSNIDPTAWEDKKCAGESRFPAQVRVVNRKLCEPLEEDSFRPILHHYDGPKFRLELNIPEALSLLDIFEEEHSG